MIARLKGLLDSVGEDWAVIDVAGVGYQVFCSTRTLSLLPQPGELVNLSVETHVREDHIHLYGFATTSEKVAFQLLTKVQGVGTRVALAIISVLSAEQMAEAIAAQDKTVFTRASGVGPKLAARLITELKDKIGAIAAMPIVPTKSKGKNVGETKGDASADLTEDAVSALVNLGYGRADAFGAVSRAFLADQGKQTLDGLIRAGLKDLAGDG